MAFETELSNLVTKTDDISDAISDYFDQKVVFLPLIYTEDCPEGTNVKKFRRDGTLVAEDIAESAAYTHSANGELTQSSVSATAAKIGVCSKITHENIRFSGNGNIVSEIAMKQAAAIGRKLDADIRALITGFSGTQTATTTLTLDDLLDAAYAIKNADAEGDLPLVFMTDARGETDLRKEMVASSATPFSQEGMISLLRGLETPNGYIGSLPGIEAFRTNSLPTNASDSVALLYNRQAALGGVVDTQIYTDVQFVSDGGFHVLVSSWTYADFIEWNDGAGYQVEYNT